MGLKYNTSDFRAMHCAHLEEVCEAVQRQNMSQSCYGKIDVIDSVLTSPP
jgi:hypothetical protein